MGSFISMIIVNTVGGLMLITGTAPVLAPVLGFTKVGIAAYSIAASAHSWYGGALAGSAVISQLMAATMYP